jgi:hypothetical protein
MKIVLIVLGVVVVAAVAVVIGFIRQISKNGWEQ